MAKETGSEKEYEAMLILKNTIEEAARKIQAAVEKVFKETGVKVCSTQVWGKRPLGYKIRGFTEGYYLLYDLSLEPSAAKNLQEKLKLQEGVLRCLLTLKETGGEVKQ